MNDNTSAETEPKVPKGNGRIEYKQSVLQTLIETQETVTFILKSDGLELDEIRPKFELSLETIKRMKPGLMKKFYFEQSVMTDDPKGLVDSSSTSITQNPRKSEWGLPTS